MRGDKTIEIIESIKNMPDKEADMLEVFVAGFRAGKKTMKSEIESQSVREQIKQFA